jgi:hypothetical protein
MYTLLAGLVVLGVTAFAFWLVLPVDGSIRRWIAGPLEPIVAVAIVGGIGISVILIVWGAAALLT